MTTPTSVVVGSLDRAPTENYQPAVGDSYLEYPLGQRFTVNRDVTVTAFDILVADSSATWQPGDGSVFGIGLPSGCLTSDGYLNDAPDLLVTGALTAPAAPQSYAHIELDAPCTLSAGVAYILFCGHTAAALGYSYYEAQVFDGALDSASTLYCDFLFWDRGLLFPMFRLYSADGTGVGTVVRGPAASTELRAAVGTVSHLAARIDGATAGLRATAPPGSIATRKVTRVTGVPAVLGATANDGDLSTYQLDRSGDVLTLTVYNPVLASQPGLLAISIGNGTPGATVHVFVDGQEVLQAQLDSTGAVRSTYAPIDGLAAGQHDISASTDPTAPDTGIVFTTVTDATSVAATQPAPPLPLGPARYWTFQDYYRNDYGLIDSYTLPRNPETVEQHYGAGAVSSAPTSQGGTIVSWEGEHVPPTWTITGRLFDASEHDAMVGWGQRNRRAYVTDHHGDRFLVVMNGIDTQRVRDPARRWHHQYTLSFTALEGPGL